MRAKLRKPITNPIPYREIFAHLRYHAKGYGFSVTVCDLKKQEAFGDICIENRRIRIHKNLSWKTKVLTLAHEFFGHACQYAVAYSHLQKLKKSGVKKPRQHPSFRGSKLESYFIYLGNDSRVLKNTEDNIDMIEFCEKDASRRARKSLHSIYLIPLSELWFIELELDKDEVLRDHLRKFWKKWCFGKNDASKKKKDINRENNAVKM